MNNIRPLVFANSLHGFHVHATDGPVGKIDDFYFSDESWKIRHAVVDLGSWLPGRRVLLSPDILGHADWRKKFIEAQAGKMSIQANLKAETVPPETILTKDPHLLSVRIMKECSIVDERHEYQGRVNDLLIDTDTWDIRFIFIKTLYDSRLFLVSPSTVFAIDTGNRRITIRHYDEMKTEWHEYDPHYMAMFEMQEQQDA